MKIINKNIKYSAGNWLKLITDIVGSKLTTHNTNVVDKM